MVYIAGTLYDKYSYMGDTVCRRRRKKELLPLMEFAPFLFFSIKESLEEMYTDTLEGVACMKRFALEAGDIRLKNLLGFYEKHPFPRVEKWIQRHMESRAGISLYETLYRKIEAASKVYTVRDYGKEGNEKAEKERQKVTKKLEEKGFTGTYPFFRKGHMQILAMEGTPLYRIGGRRLFFSDSIYGIREQKRQWRDTMGAFLKAERIVVDRKVGFCGDGLSEKGHLLGL